MEYNRIQQKMSGGLNMEHGTLFYSNRCKYCRMVLEYIEKSKLSNNFKLVNIDTKGAQIPPTIEKVPTMLMKKGYRIIVGKDNIIDNLEEEYNYSYANKMNRMNNPNVNKNDNKKKVENQGIMEFNSDSQGNWDSFDSYGKKAGNEPTVFDEWGKFAIDVKETKVEDSRSNRKVNFDEYLQQRNLEL